MEFLSLFLLGIGSLILVASGIWLLFVAFSTRFLWGIACIVIPYAGVVFAVFHWNKGAKPFLLGLMGIMLMGGGLVVSPVVRTAMEAFSKSSGDKDDVVRFTNQILKAVDDKYTRVISPSAVNLHSAIDEGKIKNAGFLFDLQRDKQGERKLDASGKELLVIDSDGNPLVTKVLDHSPAYRAGLRVGDSVVSINGISARGKNFEELMLLVLTEQSIRLETVRSGHRQPSMYITADDSFEPCIVTKVLPGAIGYIRLAHFSSSSAAKDMKAQLGSLQDARAIIFDLRDNPGGSGSGGNAIAISSLFIHDGTIATFVDRVPSAPRFPVWERREYRLTETNLIVETSTTDKPEVSSNRTFSREPFLLRDRPLAILVNGDSASAAEMTTAAIRENVKANATVVVIGEKTYGKGIGQSMNLMPKETMIGGSVVSVTTLRYFTPNGQWLGDAKQHAPSNGITPDAEILPLKKEFKKLTPDDNQLNYAVEFLSKGLSHK